MSGGIQSPDDMLREAERAVEANPCPETRMALAAVRERVGWRSPWQIARDELYRLMKENKHPTKEICVLLGEVGGDLWSGSYLDGTVERWRVNGKCKTWKRDWPDRFTLPVKPGFYGPCSYVTDYNAKEFLCERPARPVNVTVRRVHLDGDYVKKDTLQVKAGTYYGAGQKLWAFVSDTKLPEGHNYSIGSSEGPEFCYLLRSEDRDSVRTTIKTMFRSINRAVNFRR